MVGRPAVYRIIFQRIRRERIYPFRKVGIHPRLDEWYRLHHFIRWFSIQPDVSDTEAAGMHECIPYETSEAFGDGFIRSKRRVFIQFAVSGSGGFRNA